MPLLSENYLGLLGRSPWYFYVLVLFLPDVAICQDCLIYHIWGLLLLVRHYYVWLVSQQLLLWLKLKFLLLWNTSHWFSYQDWGISCPHAAQTFMYTILATWLCFSCTQSNFLLHPAAIYWTISGTPLHSLQLGSCWLLFGFEISATSSICWWYVSRKDLVFHDASSSPSVFSWFLGSSSRCICRCSVFHSGLCL